MCDYSDLSRDRAKIALPGFPLLIEAQNGRQQELNLFGQFFIRGRKCEFYVTATIVAIDPSEVTNAPNHETTPPIRAIVQANEDADTLSSHMIKETDPED